jgi:carboxylesterase
MTDTLLPTLLPHAEPYFQRGGEVGVLCLHGFSASPAELRWLGQHLAAQGLTVYIPRMTGHGADYLDMARMRWRDWYLHALDGYHILAQQCKQVFVIGHSMGSLLALLLSTQVEVGGIVVIAAGLKINAPLFPYARWLKYALRYSDQSDKSTLPERLRAEQARLGETVTGRVRYDRWSTSAIAELHALTTLTHAHLADVTAPLLLIYSAADETVPLENQDLVAQGVRSKTIERCTLQKSGHIIPQDVEREDAFRVMSDFIQRQS